MTGRDLLDEIWNKLDPQSRPDSDVKVFVLVPLGPLYEVYGYESDVARIAEANKDSIYFWAEGDAEDFAPLLGEEQIKGIVRFCGMAIHGPTAAENSGAIPPSMTAGIPSGTGVETDSSWLSGPFGDPF